MASHEFLAGYDATDEAADGLALGRLLADRLGCELVVARVITGAGRPEVTDRRRERLVRDLMTETRGALLTVLPEPPAVELTPVLDGSVAHGLHELARAEEAGAIVVGSRHHKGLGRLLLGGGPELVADGAPCPVFVAPPGFRDAAALKAEVVGAAFDGSHGAQAALRYAAELAGRLGATLRVVTVRPPWYERPAGASHDIATVQDQARDIVPAGVELELVERQGRPADVLIAETQGEVGLLVLGSSGRSALQRVLLGSVAAAVLRGAAAPTVVATA